MNLLYDHSRLVWKFSTIVYVVWWWWCCCLVQCAAESPRRSFLKRNSKRCARNSIGQKLDEDFTNLMWSSWIIWTLKIPKQKIRMIKAKLLNKNFWKIEVSIFWKISLLHQFSSIKLEAPNLGYLLILLFWYEHPYLPHYLTQK